MKPAPRSLATLSAIFLFGAFQMNAQSDGYQKSDNQSGTRPATYTTPADGPYNAPRQNTASQPVQQGEPREDDALRGGNFVIGSGFGYVNSVTDIEIDNGTTVQKGGNKGYQLHLTPTIGYFISRNFVFGLGMDYLVSSSESDDDDNLPERRTADTKLLFGPFTRIYFPFAGDQALFLGGVYGYGKSDTEITNDGESQMAKTTLMTFGVGPGYAIFSNGRVSLETQVKYNYGFSRNVINVDNIDQTTRTLTRGWDIVLGMHFYFSRSRSGR